MISKLPAVGTTIFTVMSRRAAELGAVNLGQGFPDYPIDSSLVRLVSEAMSDGYNQYAPMTGLPSLRQAIARKLQRDHGLAVDPDSEVTVTLGATEALFSAVQALAGAGDEVLVFDPAYDSYEPAAILAGARCVHVPLVPPHFGVNWERVRAAFSERTRLIIINTPHNPGCGLWTESDLAALAALIRGRDCRVLSDEVYEHVVYDGRRHASVLAVPELRARAVAVYSFGKTLHATGLRVGYAVAPPALSGELRKVHQFNTFSIASCLQQAIARYLEERPGCGLELAEFFQRKRDGLRSQLADSGFVLPPSSGSYFQLLDYSRFGAQSDTVMAERLLTEAGVASIPLSPFYQHPPAEQRLLRLCVAKSDETLAAGAERLRQWAERQP